MDFSVSNGGTISNAFSDKNSIICIFLSFFLAQGYLALLTECAHSIPVASCFFANIQHSFWQFLFL